MGEGGQLLPGSLGFSEPLLSEMRTTGRKNHLGRVLRGPGRQACGSGRRPTCWPGTSCEAMGAAASLSSSRLLCILLPPLCQKALGLRYATSCLSFSPCELAASLPAPPHALP